MNNNNNQNEEGNTYLNLKLFSCLLLLFDQSMQIKLINAVKVAVTLTNNNI